VFLVCGWDFWRPPYAPGSPREGGELQAGPHPMLFPLTGADSLFFPCQWNNNCRSFCPPHALASRATRDVFFFVPCKVDCCPCFFFFFPTFFPVSALFPDPPEMLSKTRFFSFPYFLLLQALRGQRLRWSSSLPANVSFCFFFFLVLMFGPPVAVP